MTHDIAEHLLTVALAAVRKASTEARRKTLTHAATLVARGSVDAGLSIATARRRLRVLADQINITDPAQAIGYGVGIGRKAPCTAREAIEALGGKVPRQTKRDSYGRKGPSETAIHISVAKHLESHAAPGTFWFHPANGGHRTKTTAQLFKRLGLKAGVPDLILIANGNVYGLELKAHDGKLSDAQAKALYEIADAGGMVAVAYSYAAAVDQLAAWQITV